MKYWIRNQFTNLYGVLVTVWLCGLIVTFRSAHNGKLFRINIWKWSMGLSGWQYRLTKRAVYFSHSNFATTFAASTGFLLLYLMSGEPNLTTAVVGWFTFALFMVSLLMLVTVIHGYRVKRHYHLDI
jgi:hypothetical protein